MAKPNRPHPAEARRRERFLARAAAIWSVSAAEAERLASGGLRSSVRINPLRGRPVEAIRRELQGLTELTAIPWCDTAYHITGDRKAVTGSRLHAAGEIYVMNASSLIPSLALDPRPKQDILDICASPGGKSAHIAELTGNRARLYLNDGIKSRLKKLKELIDIMNISVEKITNIQGQYLDKFVAQDFDRILLDAQCSGEGMADLSRPDALKFWTAERIEKMSRLQQRMLVAAFKRLRPGGVLVYATCTIAPEENEAPVDHLVRHNDDAMIEPIPVDVPHTRPGLGRWQGRGYHPDLHHARRIVPSAFMEAFFVCRIRRRPG